MSVDFTSLCASILANFFRVMHANVSPAFISIWSFAISFCSSSSYQSACSCASLLRIFLLFSHEQNPQRLPVIGIFKMVCIIFPKSREMWNQIQHIQSQKLSVSNIYFNFFYRLAHTFDPIKILNKWNLNKHNGIQKFQSIAFSIKRSI